MNVLAAVENHGYAATAALLLLSACGLPLPISIVLLTAGAAAHSGSLNLALVILCAAGAALVGDTILYLGGKFTGWWLLAGLSSARSFYRRGPRTLLFAKFIPGLGTVAAPLAGSLNMRFARFLKLDACGVLFYAAAWSTVGFLFAPFLRIIIGWVVRAGHLTAATVTGAIVLYVLWLLGSSLHDNRFSNIERVAAEELNERMKAPSNDRVVVIADVRSHGYYDPAAQRIKNSIRVEPNRLREEVEALREFMAPECEIYLYCSCARDATSVRVARELEKENCATKVITGGLKAWIKAGGPLEPVPPADVEHLPRFN
jgi:membrane protein DedA with SNARE-associated domain/rhodanese-related sulfurtransferase